VVSPGRRALSPPVADALFLPDGEGFIPTVHARGPWDPAAQHGGPPAALLARAVEALESSAPMRVVRLTVELLRPVPLTPLRVSASVVRPGRRVQLLEARLLAGDVEVCRASALRLREDPDGPVAPPPAPPPAPVPDGSASQLPRSDLPSFPTTGAELRFVSGSIEEPGVANVWIRLRHPVVAGETPSPLMRVAAAADFGNGVSSILDWRRYTFINPDLTIYLHRPAGGEWICLDASTRVEAGVGLAESALYDEAGAIGRSLQGLLVMTRS
jgi:hypothetical protein